MELTPKLNEKVMNAIAAAIKDLKPRPAVDRILTARTTGKWVHYCQVLLTYGPGKHGLAYVNLQTTDEKTGLLKTKIHGSDTKPGRFVTAKEEKRLAKAEKKLAKVEKAKAEPKTKKTK